MGKRVLRQTACCQITLAITPHFLSRQLRTAYRVDEIAEMIKRTRFAPSFAIDKVTLAGLPVWLRITLTQPA